MRKEEVKYTIVAILTLPFTMAVGIGYLLYLFIRDAILRLRRR